jgi:O-antigen biosynthesis protein
LTILMTLKEAPIGWLSRSVESVLGQLCGNWELNLLVEPEPRQELADFLRDLKGNEPRVRVICSSRCEGSDLYDQSEGSGALYMLWMSAADVLEPEAVYRFLEAASSGADIIYCDDVETSQDIDDIRYFNTRGSFSLDSYMSHPDLGALFCLRKAVMGNDFEVGDAALHRDSAELCMLALENAVRVAHIPAFLARRRAIGTTGSYGRGAKLPELSTYVRNNVPAGSVSPTSNPGTFHVDYPDDNGQTLIIVPTKDRVDLLQPCIDSIIRTTDRANARIIIIDHESQEIETQQYLDSVRDSVEIMPYAGPFNFSLMNNEAVNRFSDDAKYLLFLNNDIEATCSGWLERLRSLAARPDVGAVGPTLLYADRRVQHAGIVLGVGGPAHHTRKFVAYEGGVRPRRPRDMIVSSTRECSAVTGACLMVKAGLFADIDGFDLDLAVDFNDVDLCLRISQCGYRVLHDGRTVLLHHESATRSKGPLMSPHKERGRFVRRWRQRLALGDPFYSPLLSAASDHALGDFTEMYNPARVRRVEPICKAADQGRPRPVWHPIEYL